MPLEVTAIMIGVEDLARSKKFYAEGLGCTLDQDYPNFVSFNLGEGSSSLALYEREAAAQDAGVASELALPESIAEHCRRTAATLTIIIRAERPTQQWIYSENTEKLTADVKAFGVARLTACD